jgi:hypothetical protein
MDSSSWDLEFATDSCVRDFARHCKMPYPKTRALISKDSTQFKRMVAYLQESQQAGSFNPWKQGPNVSYMRLIRLAQGERVGSLGANSLGSSSFLSSSPTGSGYMKVDPISTTDSGSLSCSETSTEALMTLVEVGTMAHAGQFHPHLPSHPYHSTIAAEGGTSWFFFLHNKYGTVDWTASNRHSCCQHGHNTAHGKDTSQLQGLGAFAELLPAAAAAPPLYCHSSCASLLPLTGILWA